MVPGQRESTNRAKVWNQRQSWTRRRSLERMWHFPIIYQKHSASVPLGGDNLSWHPSTTGEAVWGTLTEAHAEAALSSPLVSLLLLSQSRTCLNFNELELEQSLTYPRWHWHSTDVSTGVINIVTRTWWALRYGRSRSVSFHLQLKCEHFNITLLSLHPEDREGTLNCSRSLCVYCSVYMQSYQCTQTIISSLLSLLPSDKHDSLKK